MELKSWTRNVHNNVLWAPDTPVSVTTALGFEFLARLQTKSLLTQTIIKLFPRSVNSNNQAHDDATLLPSSEVRQPFFFVVVVVSWTIAVKFWSRGREAAEARAVSKETSGQSLELTTSRLLTWLTGLGAKRSPGTPPGKSRIAGGGRGRLSPSRPSSRLPLLLQEPPAG